MSGKLQTEQHLEFLSLTEGYTGSSESTLVKMPHCLKSHKKLSLTLFSDDEGPDQLVQAAQVNLGIRCRSL